MDRSKKRRTEANFVDNCSGQGDCEDDESDNDTPEIANSLNEGMADSEEAGGSEGDTSSSVVESDMEVEVEFEARHIEEQDYYGIRRLLQQLFLKAEVNLSALADIIVSQGSNIGSVVKINSEGVVAEDESSADRNNEEAHGDVISQCHVDSSFCMATSTAGAGTTDITGSVSTDMVRDQSHMDSDGSSESDVYGVASIITLDQRECCLRVKSHLLSHCAGEASKRFAEIWNDSTTVSLLLKERFLNIPADIVPPLIHSLMKEWEAFGGGACHYIVTVARSHLVSIPATGKKRKKSPDTWNKEDLVLDFQEDTFFVEEAEFFFSYPVSEESDQVFSGQWSTDDSSLKPFRTVIFLTPSKLLEAIAALEQTLICN